MKEQFIIGLFSIFTMLFGMGLPKANMNNLYTFYTSEWIKETNIVVKGYCDQVINNPKRKPYFEHICYSYKYNGTKFAIYYVTKKSEQVNLKKRLRFMPDRRIPKEHRVYSKCYYNKHYDRGHIAPDADFDYNRHILKYTYYLSNVVPQNPYVNRKVIAEQEAYERHLAMSYSGVVVIEGIHYTNNWLKDINNTACPRIPDEYIKIFVYKIGNRTFIKAYLTNDLGKVKTYYGFRKIRRIATKFGIYLIKTYIF